MGIVETLAALLGRKSQRTGMWKFLAERAKGRDAVASQKVRNEGMRETLEQVKGFDEPIAIRQGNGEWATEIYKLGPIGSAALEPPFDRLVPQPRLDPPAAPQIESTDGQPGELGEESESDGETR